MRNKWGPLRVHRMNWNVRFRELTGWRSKNDEERRKIFAKSPRETSRKPYGSASAWIFFTETIFLTNFKWFSATRRVAHFCSALLPLFIGKRGRSLPPSSPRRARLLPPEGTAFWSNFLEGPSGPGCYLHPLFTKYTLAIFCWFFFYNVTELYEFCNDTCFLSVMSQNLTDYIIIPFLASGMLQNLTNCATMLPFDFRHVTEPHGLCNNASFWLLTCYKTSRIVQQWVPSTSKQSSKGCMPSNNGPRTKLGYESCPSLLTFYQR